MIYFDNAATTDPFESVKNLVETKMSVFGNPSSRHSLGRQAKKEIEEARAKIAALIGASSTEITFTSGGTESNNLIIRSLCEKHGRGHIITTSIEHESIIKTLSLLDPNLFSLTILPVNSQGLISLTALEKAIRPDTILVTIQMINNEIGSVQNVRSISKICRKHRVFFHSDCVQAVGHVLLDVHEIGFDAISASAHKFNGLKGTGFLYCNDKTLPIVLGGGGQENGVRSGTENVLGIQAMSLALQESLDHLEEKQELIQRMRFFLCEELKMIEGIKLNVSLKPSYSSIINFSCRQMDNESLLALLDAKEIYCSAGSACLSNGDNLSPVLKALHFGSRKIKHSLRISLSSCNTLSECEQFIAAVKEILSRYSV